MPVVFDPCRIHINIHHCSTLQVSPSGYSSFFQTQMISRTALRPIPIAISLLMAFSYTPTIALSLMKALLNFSTTLPHIVLKISAMSSIQWSSRRMTTRTTCISTLTMPFTRTSILSSPHLSQFSTLT